MDTIPSCQEVFRHSEKNTSFVYGIRRIFRNSIFLLSLHLLVVFLPLLSFILLVFFLSVHLLPLPYPSFPLTF